MEGDGGRVSVVVVAGEVRTCDPSFGEGSTGVIVDGAIAIEGERIVWVGPRSQLASSVDVSGVEEIDAGGRAVIPGFVDTHTHMVFAGNRGEEFSRRAEGQPYSAGGILSTVEATRAATEDQLLALTMARAHTMLAHGTTTAEAKSGYALDEVGEKRLLEVLHRIHDDHPLDLEVTLCAAHALPEEFSADPEGFIDAVVEMTPRLAPLARWVDVFCDEGAFTVEQSRRALQAGIDQGLAARVHANELAHSGGAQLAAELGAASADHLIYLDDADAKAMASAGTTAVLCPHTALGLGRFPDVSLLREHGVPFTIASDFNPGSSYGENIQFAIWLATRAMGVGVEEALLATTATAAKSLRRDDIGRIAPGCLADLVVLDAETALDLGYHASVNLAHMVIKRGEVTSG